MKEIEGNLIKLAKDNKFDYILHGCNCFENMGAGIAKQIALAFPDAVKADKYEKHGGNCQFAKGSYFRLGNMTMAHEKIFLENKYNNLKIVNIYSQYYPGPHLDYEALTLGLRKFRHHVGLKATDRKIRVGLPKIGAGLAGGDWNIIKPIIERELQGLDVTIVYLKL